MDTREGGELSKLSPMGLVVSIVLVDLLGFSIVMPLLAPFAREYGFSALQIGLLLAAYPMAQLVAGPILGLLSDRYGRRPVLAASQFGTAVSFLILGLSNNFEVMFLARLLDGASGGNILVAQAYVADVTRPEERSRGYGLIGMAFGLGFVLGPLLGLALVDLPVPADWRLRVPFLAAAMFSTIAWGPGRPEATRVSPGRRSSPAVGEGGQPPRLDRRPGPAGSRADDRTGGAGDPGIRGSGRDLQPLSGRASRVGADRGPGRIHVSRAGHGDGPGRTGPEARPEARRAPDDRGRAGDAGRGIRRSRARGRDLDDPPGHDPRRGRAGVRLAGHQRAALEDHARGRAGSRLRGPCPRRRPWRG